MHTEETEKYNFLLRPTQVFATVVTHLPSRFLRLWYIYLPLWLLSNVLRTGILDSRQLGKWQKMQLADRFSQPRHVR
jgi:hypothetical protein